MIVLTGVSGGIGEALLVDLLALDAVVGTYNKRRPKPGSWDSVDLHKLDLESPSEIAAFVDRLGDRLSRITLINLATTSVDGLAASYDPDEWDHVLRVNLTGSFLLSKALLPMMIQQRWGRIVNISSVAALEGRVGTVAYSASKTALIGMSRVLAKEYAKYGITANVLMLGYFDVGLIGALSEESQKEILDRIPSRTFGRVSNISKAIEFLIGSEYVNGTTISIDGGV